MPSPWMQLSSAEEIRQFFAIPLDFAVNVHSTHNDYRSVLQGVCGKQYVRSMLSPRYTLPNGVDQYSLSHELISDQELRKKVLQGVGLGHVAMGDRFMREYLGLFGSNVGCFALAAAYDKIYDDFYLKQFKPASKAQLANPYDFKPYFLSVVIAIIEVNYPPKFHMLIVPHFLRLLNLPLEDVTNISDRVRRLTGRPEMVYTWH